jgi:hypothetical protein
VEIFVIAIVPRTCWVVQNHKIGASDALLLFPSTATDSTKVYSGDPTTITCSEDDGGCKILCCKHIVQKANEKKKKREVLYCTHTWKVGQGVTIGTLKSHCRSKH